MIGKYRRTLDSKGRIAIPAGFREELGESFYISIGMGHSLLILSQAGWRRIEERRSELPLSSLQQLRFFYANAVKCEPDKQGRVLLPAELRSYAGLGEEIVIIGIGEQGEIWDASVYDEQERQFFADNGLDSVLSSLAL